LKKILKNTNQKKKRKVTKRDFYKIDLVTPHQEDENNKKQKIVETDKAYKLLAKQENISNNLAKTYIDKGLVSVKNRVVKIARGELPLKTEFVVKKIKSVKKIFEDENLLVINKPNFLDSDEVLNNIDFKLQSDKKEYILLHRLDRDTSGILLFAKNEEFRIKAIREFKNQKVYKEYSAIVRGKLVEKLEINKNILTIKENNRAKSVVSKTGNEAISIVEPISILGDWSLLKVVILTGRTHQIRVHLADANLPIVGDILYGNNSTKSNRNTEKRLMLHSKKIKILDYSFEIPEPREFEKFLKLD
jgi:23S rRNA pseudouridine1911/1915/1917 synthase